MQWAGGGVARATTLLRRKSAVGGHRFGCDTHTGRDTPPRPHRPCLAHRGRGARPATPLNSSRRGSALPFPRRGVPRPQHCDFRFHNFCATPTTYYYTNIRIGVAQKNVPRRFCATPIFVPRRFFVPRRRGTHTKSAAAPFAFSLVHSSVGVSQQRVRAVAPVAAVRPVPARAVHFQQRQSLRRVDDVHAIVHATRRPPCRRAVFLPDAVLSDALEVEPAAEGLAQEIPDKPVKPGGGRHGALGDGVLEPHFLRQKREVARSR